MSASYYRIDAQNGWDRYNQLEIYKTYTFAHVYPIRVDATLFFPKNGGITVGAQFQPSSETDLGKQAGLSVEKFVPFIGFSYYAK
jgi:hypothetical protein